MKKILYIGDVKQYDGKYWPVFCKASIEDGKLSISGVIGPMKSGNAKGGCGQIDMEFKHRDAKDDDAPYSDLIAPEDIKFSKEWDAEKWLDFLSIWKRWHLNDMKASCEHQRALGWEEEAREEVTLYQWKLKAEYRDKRSILQEEAVERAASTDSVSIGFSPEEKRIMKLEYKKISTTPDLSGYDIKYYEKDGEEKKTKGWLRTEEHPAGILCKPCPVCGYEYGSAWKKEALPGDVLDFISNLPDASKKPAWV